MTGGEIVLVKRRLGCRLVELNHRFINDYSNYTCKYAVSFNMQCHALSLT